MVDDGSANVTIRPKRSDSNCLTADGAAPPTPAGTGLEAHVYAAKGATDAITFLSNYGVVGSAASLVEYGSSQYWLAAHSVVILRQPLGASGAPAGPGVVLFNTSTIGDKAETPIEDRIAGQSSSDRFGIDGSSTIN